MKNDTEVGCEVKVETVVKSTSLNKVEFFHFSERNPLHSDSLQFTRI